MEPLHSHRPGALVPEQAETDYLRKKIGNTNSSKKKNLDIIEIESSSERMKELTEVRSQLDYQTFISKLFKEE
jgi:hypothetical protein